MVFRVIEDKQIKIPKDLKLKMNHVRVDDDTQTTTSLIERAILKNMESLCFNLKKMKKQGQDFERYIEQKREAAIEVSSKQSSELGEKEREPDPEGKVSPNLSEDNSSRRILRKQRTRSQGCPGSDKKSDKYSNRKERIRARSLPRSSVKITSNRISNLT